MAYSLRNDWKRFRYILWLVTCSPCLSLKSNGVHECTQSLHLKEEDDTENKTSSKEKIRHILVRNDKNIPSIQFNKKANQAVEPKNRKGRVSPPQGTLNATEFFLAPFLTFFCLTSFRLTDLFPTADQISQDSRAILRCLSPIFTTREKSPLFARANLKNAGERFKCSSHASHNTNFGHLKFIL